MVFDEDIEKLRNSIKEKKEILERIHQALVNERNRYSTAGELVGCIGMLQQDADLLENMIGVIRPGLGNTPGYLDIIKQDLNESEIKIAGEWTSGLITTLEFVNKDMATLSNIVLKTQFIYSLHEDAKLHLSRVIRIIFDGDISAAQTLLRKIRELHINSTHNTEPPSQTQIPPQQSTHPPSPIPTIPPNQTPSPDKRHAGENMPPTFEERFGNPLRSFYLNLVPVADAVRKINQEIDTAKTLTEIEIVAIKLERLKAAFANIIEYWKAVQNRI